MVTLSSPPILQCIYQNKTARLQVIRVEGVQWTEKTLAAGEVHQFSANQDSYLDIYTYEISSMLLDDRIPCHQLEITASQSK